MSNRAVLIAEVPIMIRKTPLEGISLVGCTVSSPVDGLIESFGRGGYSPRIVEALNTTFKDTNAHHFADELLELFGQWDPEINKGKPVVWATLRFAYINSDNGGWILSSMIDLPTSLSDEGKVFPMQVSTKIALIFKDFYTAHLKDSDMIIQYFDKLMVMAKDKARNRNISLGG